MFLKKKQVDGITSIEKRICDLEGPYKYKIGDEISTEFELKFRYENGKIVDIKHKYESPYNHVYSDFMIVSNNPVDFMVNGLYKRINYYLVYFEERQWSSWRSENELANKIKKK